MIGDSFKQQCPSCEAMVAVKNSGMIGKRMECPKCKDRFLVSKPAMQPSDEDDDDADEAPAKRTAPRPSAAGKNPPSAKAKKPETYDVEDDNEPKPKPAAKKPLATPSDETRGGADDDEEDDEKPAPRKPAKPAAQDDDDDEDDGVEIHFEPGAKKLLSKAKPRDDDDDEDEKPAKPAVKKIPPKAPPKDEDDDDEEGDERPAKPAMKKIPPKAPARDDDEDDEDLKPAKAPPKKAPMKSRVEDEDEDENDLDDEDRKPVKKAPVKAKGRPEPEDVDEEDEVPRPGKKPPSRLKAKAKPAADDDDDESESESAPAKKSLLARLGLGSFFAGKAKSNGVKSKDATSRAKVADDEEPSSETDEGQAKKKKIISIFGFKLDLKSLNLMALKAGSRKTAIGVGLAVVGIMVLVYAAYLMLFNTGPAPHDKQKINQGNLMAGKDQKLPSPPDGKTKLPPGGTLPGMKDVDGVDKTKKDPDPPLDLTLKAFDPSITNLLPADAEQVIHMNFANLFFQTRDSDSRAQLDPSQRAGPFFNAVFRSSPKEDGPFDANVMAKKLGFSPLKVDELVHAESFSAPWSFTVVHLKEKLDMKRLTEALHLGSQENEPGLKNAKMINVDHYKIPENKWLEQFGRLAPGFAADDRQQAPRRKNRPLFVHKHDAQTLVFADGRQMFNFLDGKIKKAGMPPAGANADTFTSLKSPEMRNMIDRLEKKEPQDRFMFMSVAQVQQARWPAKKGEVVRFLPRTILDVLPLMEERNNRLTLLGSSLFSKEKKQPAQKYQYRTELNCNSPAEAKSLFKDLKTGEPLKDLLEQYVKVKFETSAVDPNPKEKDPFKFKGTKPFDKTNDPKEKDKDVGKEPAKKAVPLSRASLDFDDDRIISVVLDLNLEPYDRETPLKNLTDCLTLLMADAHGELALAEEEDTRPRLARAGTMLVTDSLQKWQARAFAKGKKLPLGQYPPAAFPYALKNGSMEHDPGRRVSWMVGLLPYLGHQGLYDRVTFSSSWDDPVNWQAGRTLVPEFIDPRYPASSRYVEHPGLGQSFAATHFVGIAGVGLDAGDPIERAANPHKRGIFGYDRSASLEEVNAGRGASTTLLMIQVPRDGLAGVTPWIAGGGSTLRGVPETRSVYPFVGKGEAGTFAVMADGSVRFISSNIDDRVFKAMASYQGDTPSNFEDEVKNNARVTFSPEK